MMMLFCENSVQKAYTNSPQISTMHTTHATPQRKHTKHEQKQDLANKEQRFQVQ